MKKILFLSVFIFIGCKQKNWYPETDNETSMIIYTMYTHIPLDDFYRKVTGYDSLQEINKKCPYGQGVFMQPFGIPDNIKELVVYTQWISGGRPGSCWDDEDTINEEYSNDRPSDAFVVLDLVFKELKPDISYLQYKEIESLKQSNTYPGFKIKLL